MEIIKYTKDLKPQWDSFIRTSKNGLFLFERDYIEYHKDRLQDHSLLFFKKNKLTAVLPANIKDSTLFSHEGLTFGGIISNFSMKTSLMLELFDELKRYLKNKSITKMQYKIIPYIYSSIPSAEDEYALFVNKAQFIERQISVVIPKDREIEYAQRRKRAIKKARNNDIKISQSHDYKEYMQILTKLLTEKYDSKPTHNLDEILYLAKLFPDNIKLFTAAKDEELLAGVIIYEYQHVAKTQYIASTKHGRELGALDILFDFLINKYKKNKAFDFGTSNANNNLFLNQGLITYKEEFGARAVVFDVYDMAIA